MNILDGKRIILGVCGSIAAYKVVELARKLTLAGAQVDVILTAAAERFVGSATFQALTGRPVFTDLWALPEDGRVGHVSLGAKADLVIVAPATANTLAHLAAGLCDDLLTTTVLATSAPVLCAPAMNPQMYAAAATQQNIALLRQRGFLVLEPTEGRMAEEVVGKGRMPEASALEGESRALLGQRLGSLRGRKVVVTAGGTREVIDPIRFVGNWASGQMGYALAEAARDLGAAVTLISGPTQLASPPAMTVLRVQTALQMHEAVQKACAHADILIMNAAVADFRPAQASPQKLKKAKNATGLTLHLVPNPDILVELLPLKGLFKVGFAAETQDLLSNAQGKLERKGLDMIVANEATTSMAQPTVQATIITANGKHISLPNQAKDQAAYAILAVIAESFLLKEQG